MRQRGDSHAEVRLHLGPLRWVALAVAAAALLLPPRYVGTGEVVEVDREAAALTIDHRDIPGLMDAMRMRLAVDDASMLDAISPGDAVGFALRFAEVGVAVSALWRDTAPVAADSSAEERMGHHHRSQHGGVVGMSGLYHLEALVTEAGTLRVYPSDLRRRPLPLDHVSGVARVAVGDGEQALELERRWTPTGEAFEATLPATDLDPVTATFELRYKEQPIEIEFVLPGAGAVHGMPTHCESVATDAAAGSAQPRCTVAFPLGVTAIDAAPNGHFVAIGVVDHPVTLWSSGPTSRVAVFDDPPHEPAPADHGAHPVAANAIAVRPDGLEVIVAYEKRLVRYATGTAEAFSQYRDLPTIVREARWSPISRRVLVSGYYENLARVVNVTKGKLVRELTVDAPASGVAVSPDGQRAAVATESGTIFVFDRDEEVAPIRLAEARGDLRQLAFVGELLASVGQDGTLRLWDAKRAVVVARAAGLGAQFRLAVSADAGRIATAGVDGRVHVFSAPDLEAVATVDWHGALVTGLAWAGEVLVSGDDRGRVAFWDRLE